MCELCGRATLHPTNAEQRDRHRAECAFSLAGAMQRAGQADMECGICLSSVVDQRRQFGLLTGCNHVFCMKCMREWRGDYATSIARTARTCPVCRQHSHAVVPCDYFPESDEAKADVYRHYRLRLSEVPCKKFDWGKGVCPHGSSCWYSHRLKNGEKYAPKLRKVVVADGATGGTRISVLPEPRLSLSELMPSHSHSHSPIWPLFQ